MSRRALVVVLGMVAVAAILMAGMFIRTTSHGPTMADIGGPFRLASSKGGVVDSQDLTGKPYAVFFGYTHCPEVCPTTLYEMSKSLQSLGPAAAGFRVFFITVDPERDTATAMADYIGNFDPRMEALVPTQEQLSKLASDFRVFYQKVPTSDGSYSMDHTATIFLMNAEGKFAGTIAFGEAENMRDAKLRKLLGTS
jgi:protein SCO1/2